MEKQNNLSYYIFAYYITSGFCSECKRDLNPRNLAKIDDNNINKKTALVKHVVNFQHNIDFNNSSILAFKSDFFKRRF